MCLGGLELKQRKNITPVHHRGAAEVRLYLLFSTTAPLKHFIPLHVQKQCDPLQQDHILIYVPLNSPIFSNSFT